MMIAPFVLSAIFVVVLGSETSSSSCKEDERLLECSPCGPSKCSHLGTPMRCAGNTARCVQQCACIDGLVWNDDGKCVLKKDCPSCGGDPNAVSGCGNHCGNTCSDYRDKEKVCMSGCRYNACDCREGYVYDEQQEKCVRPVDCAIKTCGKNEEWALSNNACQPDTCEFLFLLNPECGNETTVEPGCRCIEGFSRDESSNCIPSEECPKPRPVCKDNEFYSNCTNGCEITCSSRYRSDGRVCPGSCQEGCVCEDGYLRHDNGSCVPVEMCSPPTCNADEEYLECGPACEVTCQNMRGTCRDCTVNCTAGCFCANDTVRMLGNNSMCVPRDSCLAPQSCGANQYFDDCPEPCSEESCASLSGTQNCTMEIKGCCTPQCRCSKDFYRHDNGTCVAANDCTE